MNCPVCGATLVEKYRSASSYGTEESLYQCDDCTLYSEHFAYGSTEISIGEFTTGFHYTYSQDKRSKINDAIKVLAKYYFENQ
jgi:hypothetical protein